MFLKLLREGLGQLVVIINFITLPRRMKRDPEIQKKVDEQARKMSLYQFKRCPFCVRTRRTIHRLNLPIELRDASRGSTYRDKLKSEGGKIKVPCLHIEDNDHTQWLYESTDIIAFLEKKFGDNKSPTN